MSNWKSCYNCGFGACRANVLSTLEPYTEPCDFWRKIPCPRCDGTLSEAKTYKYGGGPIAELAQYDGMKYRHCYGCHSEFFFEEDF